VSGGLEVVVVPARRASTRLPDKLLLAESGRPLLAHTLERCLAARRPAAVLAAVDGPELAAVARAVGVEAVLTPPELPSGSDRVWVAIRERPEVARVVNVQGDEPELDPEAVDALLEALDGGAAVATLAAPFPPDSDPADPAAVKVVADLAGRALYFSRSLLPHPRHAGAAVPRLHVGVYAYTRDALARFAGRSPTPLERTEGLEQLRFLEHGEPVAVVPWPRAFPGVDTAADYAAFLARQRQRT